MTQKLNSGVYRIVIGGKHIYIGSSAHLSRRKYQHLYTLRNGVHHNVYMQNAWNKHLDIEFEVLEHCGVDEVIALEQRYLDEVFGQKQCMNTLPTAGSRFGFPHSDETRKKMSDTALCHEWTDAEKERLRYKRSPETIEKMKLAQQNKTSEWKERLSESGMGHAVSAETRFKISESLKGQKQSEETNKKRSESLKKTWEKRKAAA